MDGTPTSADIVIRSATDADALSISFLLGDLGYPIEPSLIVEKLAAIRDSPLNRVWVVELRANGIGRRLVGVAEHFARDIHCERLEVTSGEHRHDAHRFYTGLGFSLRSARFVKSLDRSKI